jgi:hypothetical protein
VKFLKMRDVPELHDDPAFDYMIGRLVGATEMLAYYVTLYGDGKMRGMARRTYSTLEFFFRPGEETELPIPPEQQVAADQQVTKEIPKHSRPIRDAPQA